MSDTLTPKAGKAAHVWTLETKLDLLLTLITLQEKPASHNWGKAAEIMTTLGYNLTPKAIRAHVQQKAIPIFNERVKQASINAAGVGVADTITVSTPAGGPSGGPAPKPEGPKRKRPIKMAEPDSDYEEPATPINKKTRRAPLPAWAVSAESFE